MHLPVVKELTVTTYLKELAEDSLFPSAGAATALGCSQAAALFAMVCRVNLRKLKGKGKKEKETYWQKKLQETKEIIEESLELAQADGAAYLLFVNGEGPKRAMEIPLQMASCADRLIKLIKRTLPKSYKPVRADAETACCLAAGSKKAALAVARHNIPLFTDQDLLKPYLDLIAALSESEPDAAHVVDDPV